MADDWKTDDVEALFNAVRSLETLDETERFFRDLCTLEGAPRHRSALGGRPDARRRDALRRDLAARPAPARPRSRGSRPGCNHGEGGYRAMLDKLETASRAGTVPYPVAGER